MRFPLVCPGNQTGSQHYDIELHIEGLYPVTTVVFLIRLRTISFVPGLFACFQSSVAIRHL